MWASNHQIFIVFQIRFDSFFAAQSLRIMSSKSIMDTNMELKKGQPSEAVESFPAAASVSKPRQGNALKVYYFVGGSAGPPVPDYLFVKYGNGQAVPVYTKLKVGNEERTIPFVGLFIDAIKQKLSPELNDFSVGRITLHVSASAAALDSRLNLLEVVENFGITEESTLIVKTKGIS
jgi:hypothetical protein